MTCRATLRAAFVFAGLSISGCSFEAASDGTALVSNSCSVDADCGQGARCNGTMCIAREVENSLRVVLDVTPVPVADGADPVSITIAGFDVQEGPMTRQWELPRPVTVRGRVRNGDRVVGADVTLTPPSETAGLPVKAATATVAPSSSAGALPELDFEVRVAREGEYTLRVQPKDTSLPPVRRVIDVEQGEDIDIDYGELGLEDHTVELDVLGANDDRPLVVRAFDNVTGEPISSTAPVVDAHATLRFSAEPMDYRIVVRPDGAYDPEGLSDPENIECDHDTPVLPELSINATDVEANDGVLQLMLPEAPVRVRYEGTIELCDGADAPESLPITLRSTNVALPDSAAGWSAKVATDTQAVNRSGDRYSFCVDVFQGEYAIVVTPPTSTPCELFAEHRLISAPNGRVATSAVLEMSRAAKVSGTLETLDNMALAATTVDVRSLAREGVELHADDASLTAYNRSRQTTTDAAGEFSVPVDRGSYDIVLKPPAGSGYAWYVRRDVTIASRESFMSPIDMMLPIGLDCGITYEPGDRDESSTLAGAEIAAYGVVTDAVGVERAIEIARAVADERGRFMLLLPTEIGVGLWGSTD